MYIARLRWREEFPAIVANEKENSLVSDVK
jgi:hypothetical protein